MYWDRFKYLFAYTIPLTGFMSVAMTGWWSYATVLYAFVCIPILEVVLARNAENYDDESHASIQEDRFFDFLLWLNVPILYLLFGFFVWASMAGTWTTPELVGKILSVGIVGGANGINVAHELGHKTGKWEQWAAKALLLPVLYQHFTIEHNRGHHVHVATPKDPATSRKNELVYTFWFRSIIGSYFNAWSHEKKRLDRSKISLLSWHNEMIRITVFSLGYLSLIGAAFGGTILWQMIAIAVVSILLLESINYIEHYGIQRKKLLSGRYEVVTAQHSWNSDHLLGRIVLYELVRHSDHHYKAAKKYQNLDSIASSPQLPAGYPTSILIALVPPFWFWLMNSRI